MPAFWHAEDSGFFHTCWECPHNLAIESDRIAGRHDSHDRRLRRCEDCRKTRKQHRNNDCCGRYPCRLVELV